MFIHEIKKKNWINKVLKNMQLSMKNTILFRYYHIDYYSKLFLLKYQKGLELTPSPKPNQQTISVIYHSLTLILNIIFMDFVIKILIKINKSLKSCIHLLVVRGDLELWKYKLCAYE